MVEDVERIEREHNILKFKKELGLAEVPYEELHLYLVDDTSVTGVNSNNLITAKEYVDRNIEQLKKSYDSINFMIDTVEDFDEDGFPVLDNNPVLLLDESNFQREESVEVFNYYAVEINDVPYTVIVSKNVFDYTQQVAYVTNHWSFKNEKHRNMLTQYDLILSFYQFANFVGGMKNPNEKIDIAFDEIEDLTNMISQRLNTSFEGGATLDGF